MEHLALHGQGVAEYHYNGSTSTVYTTFQVQGSDTDVVNYLTGVCESLERLPMHRLETEKEILRTEAGGRSRGVNHQMPAWRYGAQGHGLVSYPEWGLSRLDSGEVERWDRTWFTRQNAALWIAGSQIPSGLRLKLREGERMPVTAPKSVLPATPAYFVGDQGKIVLDAVVSRRPGPSARHSAGTRAVPQPAPGRRLLVHGRDRIRHDRRRPCDAYRFRGCVA